MYSNRHKADQKYRDLESHFRTGTHFRFSQNFLVLNGVSVALDVPTRIGMINVSHLSLFLRRPSLLRARCRGCALVLGVSLSACLLFAASPRPTGDRIYPRIILTCPLAASSIPGDAQRPLFAHTAAETAAAALAGTPLPPLFYRMEIADDGKTAIVEFSSPNPAVLAAIRAAAAASTDPTVQSYDTSVVSYTALEQSLQQIKASFTLRRFLGAPSPPPAAAAASAGN